MTHTARDTSKVRKEGVGLLLAGMALVVLSTAAVYFFPDILATGRIVSAKGLFFVFGWIMVGAGAVQVVTPQRTASSRALTILSAVAFGVLGAVLTFSIAAQRRPSSPPEVSPNQNLVEMEQRTGKIIESMESIEAIPVAPSDSAETGTP